MSIVKLTNCATFDHLGNIVFQARPGITHVFNACTRFEKSEMTKDVRVNNDGDSLAWRWYVEHSFDATNVRPVASNGERATRAEAVEDNIVILHVFLNAFNKEAGLRR